MWDIGGPHMGPAYSGLTFTKVGKGEIRVYSFIEIIFEEVLNFKRPKGYYK